jgi:hypothetical protein
MTITPPFGLTRTEYADALGEDRQHAEPMDWQSTAMREMDEHEPFPCTMVYHWPCRGTVVWVHGEYRCKECDQPYNSDQTVIRGEDK